MLPVPDGVLRVTVLQSALDAYLHAHPRAGIDFIHGTDTLLHLADAPGRIGFVLPDFPKNQLFPYVMQHGVLPRKPAPSAEHTAAPETGIVKSCVFCYTILITTNTLLQGRRTAIWNFPTAACTCAGISKR